MNEKGVRNMSSLVVLEKEVRVTSIDLVEMINAFRAEEGNTTELQHKTLLESIRTEIKALEKGGLGQQNFLPSSYINKQNKEQPCYLMNKAGALQMLNKESAVVRYKTVEYIEKLEKERNKQDSFMIQDPIARAKRWIEEQEEKQALENKIKEDAPLVALAENRIDKKGCFSITDATKSLGLKRGNITRWAKEEGYIHKVLQEVNKKGEGYFKVYSSDGKHNCIGITEDGLRLIKENINYVRAS